MIPLARRNLSTVGFGVGVVMILIVGGTAMMDLRALIMSNSEVGHTLIVLSQLNETLALITEAESGQRGYIITGEEKYLEPYDEALSPTSGIRSHVRELRQLTSDNPNQQKVLDLLDSLVAEKLLFFPAAPSIDLESVFA